MEQHTFGDLRARVQNGESLKDLRIAEEDWPVALAYYRELPQDVVRDGFHRPLHEDNLALLPSQRALDWTTWCGVTVTHEPDTRTKADWNHKLRLRAFDTAERFGGGEWLDKHRLTVMQALDAHQLLDRGESVERYASQGGTPFPASLKRVPFPDVHRYYFWSTTGEPLRMSGLIFPDRRPVSHASARVGEMINALAIRTGFATTFDDLMAFTTLLRFFEQYFDVDAQLYFNFWFSHREPLYISCSGNHKLPGGTGCAKTAMLELHRDTLNEYAHFVADCVLG